VVDVEGNRDSAVRRVYVDTAALNGVVWNTDTAGHRTVYLDDAITLTTAVDPLVHTTVALDFGDSLVGTPSSMIRKSDEPLEWTYQWKRTGKRNVLRVRTTASGISVVDTMKFFVKDWSLDQRDGKRYPFVPIGKQVWMATNMMFDTLIGSHVSYNVRGGVKGVPDSAYWTDRGYLYDWVGATRTADSCVAVSCSLLVKESPRGVCPEGWKLPSKADWGILRTYIASLHSSGSSLDYSMVGYRLKADRDWGTGTPGEDEFGFSAKPTQFWVDNGGYWGGIQGSGSVQYANFWIWSESSDSSSYQSNIESTNLHITFSSSPKASRYPVRCIRSN
jgi:uncharacterized protein (TIGR02145 family)